jgi:hypothetical protein
LKELTRFLLYAVNGKEMVGIMNPMSTG